MAAKITHLEILKQTAILLEHGSDLQKEIAELLARKKMQRYAGLGAVAPDLFYFYHIFNSKKSARSQFWGNRLHHERVFEFSLSLLDDVRAEKDEHVRSKKLAFALGYLSHCAVDIATHPYIFYITGDYYSRDSKTAEEAQVNHLRVEYALDAYLIYERWRLHPYQYSFLKYIDCRQRNPLGKWRLDLDIWQMFVNSLKKTYADFDSRYYGSSREILPGDIVNEAFLGFIRFHRLLDSRFRIVRALLRFLDFITFRKIRARALILPEPPAIDRRLTNEERRLWKYPAAPDTTSTESFMDLVHKASHAAAETITDAYQYMNNRVSVKALALKYSGFNLDTGIRSDKLEMVAFDVIQEQS